MPLLSKRENFLFCKITLQQKNDCYTSEVVKLLKSFMDLAGMFFSTSVLFALCGEGWGIGAF